MTAPQPAASSSRPFAAAPDPSRYFPASAVEEARVRVCRSIQRGEGPVLVIGAAGLGKTLLLEVVAQQFRGQMQSILLVGGQLCTRRALLQMVLFQLDLPYRDMDETELRLSLLDYLQPQGAAARSILLLVDEADALPPRLLEELRVLTNLSASGQLLVKLVLAGSATLEEQFADPKLDLFSQRISARSYLSPFGREETFQYVRAQVAAAGNDPNALFADDGLEAIFATTDGVPRLINQLGDQLLWMVDETGYAPLDGMIVQQAWSELQQLPAPWNLESSEPVGTPVEYGELDAADECEAGLGEFVATHEETDYTADSYGNEYEDHPASIPLRVTQPPQQESEIIDLTDDLSSDLAEGVTYDATDQLLEQLSVMCTSEIEPEVGEPAVSATVQNPFDEEFDSEEIVLDRYSAFESLLLAEAPRVANGTDMSFAQQLKKCEAIESESDASLPIAGLGGSEEQPVGRDVADGQWDRPSFVVSDSVGSGSQNNEPGELLVIEDDIEQETAVVSGQKFRQLFSSLESTNEAPCFG